MAVYSIDSLDSVMKFITDTQSAKRELWKSFVRQYRDKTDTPRNGGYRGEYWGKTMRGAVLVYKYTRDENLYGVLEETVRDILATAEEDGRISTYNRGEELQNWDVWCRKYVSVGLEYFLEICKDEALKTQIIGALKAHCDYIIERLGAEPGKKSITQTSKFWDGLNSCSILKSFVVLYELTGENRYFDFASYIISTGFTTNFNVIQTVLEGRLKPGEFKIRKVYEMTSCFEGLLEAYKVTKNPELLRAAESFAALVATYETTVVGGAGCDVECFNNSVTAQLKRPRSVMQETCVTVSLMLYYNELYKVTGKPMYLRKIDFAYRNAYLGAINNMQSKLCHGFPFTSYAPLINDKRASHIIGGCLRIEKNQKYGCCVAIAGAGAGVYAEAATEVKNGTICINYYTPHTSRLTIGGEVVELRLEAPHESYGRAILSIKAAKPMLLKLAFLKPQSDSSVSYISDNLRGVTYDGDYIFANLDAKANESVIIEFDVPYTVERLPVSEKYGMGWFYLRRGNTVFATDRRYANPGKVYFGKVGSITVQTAPIKPGACLCASAAYHSQNVTFIDYASAGKTLDDSSRFSVLMPYSERAGIYRLMGLLLGRRKN